MNKSFRLLDELTVNAEYRARNIYNNFMERMVGIRANVQQQIEPEVQDASAVSAGTNLQENSQEVYSPNG
jgi:hypothetical protein